MWIKEKSGSPECCAYLAIVCRPLLWCHYRWCPLAPFVVVFRSSVSRHLETGQPEEWMERGMCISRGEWGGVPLPGQSFWTTFPPHPPTRGNEDDLPILILDSRTPEGRNGRRHQSGTEIGSYRTTIPHQQGHTNLQNQYALPPQWRSKRISTCRILRHTNPKDGQVAGSNI